ncbi:hypothetical protein HG536_0H03530 [Torulaspora globosa]|uniref:Mitochondrial outer membrane protein OM14 C-terminal domain-containing protein n=1 Tax=Torulaspora globosa TaxID=48254 RepID=A0A7G3ZN91_9SACH|nr:uncharacterized protein HG536_0H03530 [Torulaspora globosa]QLL34977.1 hypothetical protein HG536_0H03530 [Torulaspora globosa]
MSEHHAEHSKRAEKHAERAGEELKKAAEEVKKDEPYYREKAHQCSSYIWTKFYEAANYVYGTGQSSMQYARSAACRAMTELKNPVILLNVLAGSGVIGALLTGYAKYDARYLKNKSDGDILCLVGSATALLAIDTVLSVKYYSKYDKKKP